MRKLTFLAGLLCVIITPATARAVTLVNPDGSPAPTYLQRWANSSRMPTLPGSLIVETSLTECSGAPACSYSPNTLERVAGLPYLVRPFPTVQPTTFLSPFADRWDLLWEEGHQLDWALLTDAQRAALATLWRSTTPWWDSLQSLLNVSEDGLEAQFAGAYADCASGFTATSHWVPGVHGNPHTCEAIAIILALDHADSPVLPQHHRR